MLLSDVAILLVRLDGSRPRAALLESLLRPVEGGDIRLLDFVVITRHSARGCRLTEVDADEFALAGLALGAAGLLGIDDAAVLAAGIRIGESGAIVLVERHTATWSTLESGPLRDALIDVRPVPASVANAVLQSALRRSRTGKPRRARNLCTGTRHAPVRAVRR